MKKYKVIGLMSGTSLDGLDLGYFHLWKEDEKWNYEILATKSVSYDQEFKAKLKDAIYLKADELLIFHNSYGQWLGEQTKTFIIDNHLEVDLVSSHGHTTHHQPQNGLTFQIGSGQHLANTSGYCTVCDFRSNDVALGGEGAPLVPIGDKLLLDQYDFCLNLGGISNISFDHHGQRVAYDVGLANMVLNHITAKKGLAYDKGGELAAKGSINTNMLKQLNALEYYKLAFPKSTGYEWFVEKVVPIVENTQDSIENLLHTSIHHICDQLAIQISTNAVKDNSRLLVTGGGALNTFLMNTLQDKLGREIEVVIPHKLLVEFKEALVFALMAVLRLENTTNVFSSVTGASKDSCSGVVYFPS
ncbi:anhydro-N-acetylmuramic acid kinase [Muriicola sp. Z0-33]|uniref:anhydro-N-acetylmuramic acid kinase n=1 Tax=Muriicola sp. Z0-33 TaxID=2816957 RepID=UPI00223778DF|nr:anhydro-N-acetylmuramic acid kinase [Muriicola sp. Z0-33]MCW5515807.1 anhydro-N-acetylmuramic acid kinase [Muriicola sp. Z0-33]